MRDPDENLAKRACDVAGEVWSRKLFRDPKIITMMTDCCTGKSLNLSVRGCGFFMNQTTDDEDTAYAFLSRKALKKHLFSEDKKYIADNKQANKRKRKHTSMKDRIKSKMNKISKVTYEHIDLIQDPLVFCEKMLTRVKNAKEKLE